MRKSLLFHLLFFLAIAVPALSMGFAPKDSPVIDRAYFDYIIPVLVFGLFPLVFAVLVLLSRSERHKGVLSEIYLIFFLYLFINMSVWLFLRYFDISNRILFSSVMLMVSGIILIFFALLKWVVYKRSLKVESIHWQCHSCGVNNAMTQVCWQCGEPRVMG
ncbi:MAG: zinc finger Ran-binding domain-containing protein [Candidatus Theseobacter exili]|nr:zinc finger Ran-binding domain-containing protein [Candidatus Theseobacter exili]